MVGFVRLLCIGKLFLGKITLMLVISLTIQSMHIKRIGEDAWLQIESEGLSGLMILVSVREQQTCTPETAF